MLRILRYGLLYWVIGLIITFTEVQLRFPPLVVQILFYIISIAMPLFFFGLYFHRTAIVRSWKDGLRVGLGWGATIILFDVVVYLWLLHLSWRVYFSINFLIEIVLLLGIGSLIALLAVKRRQTGGPEGLS